MSKQKLGYTIITVLLLITMMGTTAFAELIREVPVDYQPEGNPDFSSEIPWEDNGEDLSNKPWVNNNVPGTAEEPEEQQGEEGAEAEVTEAPKSGTQSLDWYTNGQALLTKYPNIKIYDINSGITWSAKYINGKNHADVIPAAKSDADKLSKNNITGSYVRRPVIVTVNGVQYAGSMYAVGHGETSYCNYFKGVMCIHFTGSQTHGTKRVDSDHQSAIKEALQYGN